MSLARWFHRISKVTGDSTRANGHANNSASVVSSIDALTNQKGTCSACRRCSTPAASRFRNPNVVNQLCGLERRTARWAKIDRHGPGSHDDLANAVAGAADQASGRREHWPRLWFFCGRRRIKCTNRRRNQVMGLSRMGPLKGGYATKTN